MPNTRNTSEKGYWIDDCFQRPVNHDGYIRAKRKTLQQRAQELCESGRPGLPVPNIPYALCGRRATLNRSSKDSFAGSGQLRHTATPSATEQTNRRVAIQAATVALA